MEGKRFDCCANSFSEHSKLWRERGLTAVPIPLASTVNCGGKEVCAVPIPLASTVNCGGKEV